MRPDWSWCFCLASRLGKEAQRIRDEHGDVNPRTIESAIIQRTRRSAKEFTAIAYSDAGMGRIFGDVRSYVAYREAELCGRLKNTSSSVTTLDNNLSLHQTWNGGGGVVW